MPDRRVVALAVLVAGCADPLPAPPPPTDDLPHARIGGIGRVETERPTVRVSSSAPGLIERVHVTMGESVAAGQVLVTFAASSQEAAVRAAEAELAEATAALTQVRDGHQAFEVDEAGARAAAARTEAELARRRAERAASLVESGSVSSAEVEGAQLEARQAAEAARAAEARHTGVAGGPRAGDVQAARARVDRARADLELAQDARNRTAVTAPRAGTVLAVFAREGEFFQPGDPDGLVLLADVGALRVRVMLDERTVGQVLVGQRASVYTDAAPQDEIEGEVAEIAPLVRSEGDEPGLEVWVTVSAEQTLLPGQRVTVLLEPGAA